MITALSVRDELPRNFCEKIKAFFNPFTVSAVQISCGDLSVLHINFVRRRGKIRFDKIYSFTIGSTKEILCKPDIDLKNTPFVRFENYELLEHLFFCAMKILFKNISQSLENRCVTLYDPNGRFPRFMELLLHYAPSVCVITSAFDLYEKESNRCMRTLGALPNIYKSLQTPAEILISPVRISSPVPLEHKSLVFTPYTPAVNLGGIVFDHMLLKAPPEFADLRQEDVDETELLCAAYSLEHRHELCKIPIEGFSSCGRNYSLNRCAALCKKTG